MILLKYVNLEEGHIMKVKEQASYKNYFYSCLDKTSVKKQLKDDLFELKFPRDLVMTKLSHDS